MTPRRVRVIAGDHRDPAAALRAHLVDTTARLLAERGLAGLTTRAIARAAEVSDGVLYNHFADKDELLLAAMSSHVEFLFAEFAAVDPAPGTGTVAGNLAVRMAAGVTLQARLLPLLAGLIGQPELLARFFAAMHSSTIGGPQRVISSLEDYLRDEQRLGRLRSSEDAHIAATLLFGATQLQALASRFSPRPENAAGELTPIVDFITRALGARTDQEA
jgi:AcrR family transcriptional regulator